MDVPALSFLEPQISSDDTAQELMAAAESWLQSRSGRFRRMPALLLNAYDEETRHQRSRAAGIVSLLGTLIAAVSYPMLYNSVPDMHRAVTVLFLCGALPFSLAVSVLVLLNPRPLLREVLLGLNGIINAGVLTYLFMATRDGAVELYVAAIFLLMLFSTVTVQLRFSVAVWVVAAMTAMYAVGVHGVHAFAPNIDRSLFAISLTAGIYMLIANWRMQGEQQRSFVLTLRERLRRHDLYQRNLELDELARRDALTGLANRRAYDDWLMNSWRQARGAGAALGLIVIDVDQFKAYNDFYGHPAGDSCLQTVARCLRDQLRGTSDHVARMGGEEFAVLLPGLSGGICADVAERLRTAVTALELPHLDNENGRIVTISCGAASLVASDATTPRDLVAAADAALYHAKQTGRNRVCLADAGPARRDAPVTGGPPMGSTATGLA
jgi:diguanylate cyclase (GGDEF)-like protein